MNFFSLFPSNGSKVKTFFLHFLSGRTVSLSPNAASVFPPGLFNGPSDVSLSRSLSLSLSVHFCQIERASEKVVKAWDGVCTYWAVRLYSGWREGISDIAKRIHSITQTAEEETGMPKTLWRSSSSRTTILRLHFLVPLQSISTCSCTQGLRENGRKTAWVELFGLILKLGGTNREIYTVAMYIEVPGK